MKFLHTSDWHLGKTLKGRPRLDEHKTVLAEIAEAMGVPLNTVRSRLRLAKTALRAAIQDNPTAQEELGED